MKFLLLRGEEILLLWFRHPEEAIALQSREMVLVAEIQEFLSIREPGESLREY